MYDVFSCETTAEEWHAYCYAIHQSFVLRQRRTSYDELLSGLKKGYVIVAACQILGNAQSITILIEDFSDYNRALDKLDDRNDPLMKIMFIYVPDIAVELASA